MALPFIVLAGLFGGSVYYQHRQAKKAQAKARQAENDARVEAQAAMFRSMQVQVQDSPRIMVFGYENKIGGNLIWMHRAPDTTYHMVIALCVSPLRRVTKIYINDEVVWEQSATFVDYLLPTRFVGNRYGENINGYIVNSSPDPKPNYADILFTGAGYPDQDKWTMDHWRARDFAFGCFAISANPEMFSGPPALSFVVEPSPQYITAWHTNGNLRSDSLANPVYALLEYMRSPHGMNLPEAKVDIDSFNAAAAAWKIPGLYPAPATLKSETTYIADLTRDHRDHIEALLDCCNGRLAISSGKFKIRVGVRSTYVMSLTEDGFVGKFNVRPTIPGRDRFNAVNVTYTNQSKLWARDNYLHTLDGVAAQDRIVKDIELHVSSAAGCAQVAAQLVREQLNQITVDCEYDIRAMQLEAGDIVRVTNPKYGFTDKEFEVEQLRLESQNGEIRFRLQLQEYDPDVYNDAAAPDELANGPETNLPNRNYVPTPASFTVTEELYSVGDIVSNRVNVSWTADSYFTSSFEIQYRRVGDTDWKNGATTSQLNASFDLNVTEADDYEFRVSGVNSFGFRSPWTSTIVEILGKTAPPANVSGHSISIVGSILEATWTKNTELDLSHYKVTFAPYWRPDNSALVASSINSKSNEFTLKLPTSSSLNPADFYIVFSVVAVDTTGNESVTPATAKIGYKVPHAVLNAKIQKVKSKIILNWDDVLTQDSEKITGTDIYYQYLNLDTFRVYRSKSGTGVTALHGQVKGSFYTYDETEPGTYTFDVTWVDVLGRESTAVTVGPVVITGDEEYQVFETYSATPAEISLASQNYKYRDGYATAYTSAAGQLSADESEILLGVFLVPYFNTDEFGASNKEWSVRNQRVYALTGATPTKWSEFTAAGFDYWLQPATIRDAYPVDPRTEKQIYLQTGILYFYPATMQHSAIAVTPVFDLGSTLSSVNLQIEIDWEYYGTFPDLLIEVISGPSTFSAASFGGFPAQSGQSLNRGTFVTLGATRQFYVRLISFNETGKELVSLRGITVQVVMPEIIASGKSNVLASDAAGGGTEITMDKSFVDIRSFNGTVKGQNYTIVPDWDELTEPNKIYLAAYNSSGVAQDCEIIWEVRGI